MRIKTFFLLATLAVGAVCLVLGCGGAAEPPPQTAPGAEEDVDLIGSLVGDVEVDPEDLKEEDGEGTYTGPTKLTLNVKVVNNENPEGSFSLTATTGQVVVENGQFGAMIELNQGLYTAEFRSPLVFGDYVYTKEIDVSGPEATLTEVFPVGQVTLHTYRGNNAKGRCQEVAFTVRSETLAQDLPGKGKTCVPLIVEAGTYEVLLDISKTKVQPVKMQINAESVTTAPVKLEK